MSAATPDDARPETRPVYCYTISHPDQADLDPLFLTSYDGSVSISGIPAAYGATDPQAFATAQIRHGPVTREGNLDKTTFLVQLVTVQAAMLSRYALTGAVPRIKVTIIKCNPGPVIAGDVVEWGADTIITQSGLMASFSFEGFQIQAECVPEPLFSAHEVPRWRFSRTCNHQLYGPGCGLDAEDWKLATDIASINPSNKEIRLTDQHEDDAGNYFKQGVLAHVPTGVRLSIFSSAIDGSETLLRLKTWSPDLAVGNSVNVYAGCAHTKNECVTKFNNGPNFGGFPTIPNKNPSLHGL